MSNRGRRPVRGFWKDELDGVSASDFEKIQRDIKKFQKKVRKGKQIYFNDEWNNE